MPQVLNARRLRWVLPGGVAAAIALGSFASSVASSAASQPRLPARTAAQLLAALEQARPAGFSGTIVETTKLGLPQLPDIGGSGGDSSLSLANLLTGAHTLRIWYGGPERQRLALLGQLSESDVVHNGHDLWTYSSTSRQVTHTTLHDGGDASAVPHRVGGLTPQQAASDALSAIDPSTAVGVDRTARVAGRAAYQLVLSPKDTRSLIGSVRIAADAQTSLPLRVQVFARGASSPAIQVGFTDISFSVPDSSLFHFVPPAGSKIVPGNPLSPTVVQRGVAIRQDVGAAGSQPLPNPGGPRVGHGPQASKSRVLGSGWTAVAEFDAGQLNDSSAGPGPSSPLTAVLDKVTMPVPGGRLLTSPLLSVFLSDNGKIYVGPVSGTAIQHVAATGRGL